MGNRTKYIIVGKMETKQQQDNNTQEGSQNIFDTLPLYASLCEICKEKPREQLHHKDSNHKNNAPENLQHLCTLCHAKIHGIEPRYSELRRLVTLYIRCQKARCAIENQIRGFSRIELEIPELFNQLLKQLEQQEKLYSKQIKNLLENKEGENHKPVENQSLNVFPSYPYLKSIKGISHLLAGKLIALVDIKKSPMVSSLWAYAGQTPNSKKQKGKKANWNQELKIVCYQISDSFVKQRTPKYREIYDKEKVKQLALLNKEGENQYTIGKPLFICSPPSSKMHCERRARRKAVKEFLKDYWLECNK